MNNKDKKNITNAKKRVERLWTKHDRSAIELGLALLELIDIVNDGDAGFNWTELIGATSFADYCRQLGMENRVEYKYRNAAQNIVENRPEFVNEYKLVKEIEYLPGYTLLNLVEENKLKLKKVEGSWEDIIDLLYEKQENRYNIQVKISQYLEMIEIRPGANSNSSICTTDVKKLDDIDEINIEVVPDCNIETNLEDPDEIIEEFYLKLKTNLPSYVKKEDFNIKFSELADLFGVPISIAA